MMRATDHAVLVFQKHGGILRTSQAIAAGIHPRTLYAMRDSKDIVQVGRGVFRLSGLPPMSDPDIAFVAKRVPSAVICLRSALAIHELTTQIPHTVQIAFPPGTHSPRIEYPPIEVFRFSPQALGAGVQDHLVDGVSVRVFCAEKTLADIFKFRNRIGLDVAIEALRNYSGRQRKKWDLVLDFARLCRVERLIRPYLEAMV
jgi:predicted transcriptional regulator of viral defense system